MKVVEKYEYLGLEETVYKIILAGEGRLSKKAGFW